jgi:hypothetical protein
MGTLIATYAIAIAGVSAYAAWLTVDIRRQKQRLDAMQKRAGNKPDDLPNLTMAA